MNINELKLKPQLKKHLSLFRITAERQKQVYKQIRENAKADFDFFILLSFSTIIIALGLIINSAAVVIGGMLIAPLVWPIFALSLSLVKGQNRSSGEAIVTIFKSTLVILLLSLILGFIVPKAPLSGQEIISRTQPQLYELFIALASGFIGAFAVAYPKLGSAMAGVVVAAALVPPLAAVGLLLSEKDLAGAGGALLLFLSNLIAITLAAALLFFLSKFRGPQTEEAQLNQKISFRWTIIFLIIITVPLIIITSDTVKTQNRQMIIKEVLEAKVPSSKLLSVNLNQRGDLILIEATVRSPDNIYKYQVEELTEIFSREFKDSVILKISVIPVIEAGKLAPGQTIFNSLPNGFEANDDL